MLENGFHPPETAAGQNRCFCARCGRRRSGTSAARARLKAFIANLLLVPYTRTAERRMHMAHRPLDAAHREAKTLLTRR